MYLNTKKAGVIVLHELNSDSLILTQRSKTLRSHPGEVCFPGGAWQEGDAGLNATALRELQEELGIESTRVKLEKELEPEMTLSGYIIHPWLASINDIFPYQIQTQEVSGLFRIALYEVRNTKNYEEMTFNREGLTIKTCRFTASEFHVWGATARIMRQLASSS